MRVSVRGTETLVPAHSGRADADRTAPEGAQNSVLVRVSVRGTKTLVAAHSGRADADRTAPKGAQNSVLVRVSVRGTETLAAYGAMTSSVECAVREPAL